MSQYELNLLVFGIEVILSVTLVFWMKSRQTQKSLPWKYAFKVMAAGAFTAILAGFVTLKYSFDLEAMRESQPLLLEKYYGLMTVLNIGVPSAIEELAKYAAGTFIVIGSTRSKSITNAISTMIIIGLGFALIEDALFFLDPSTNAPYRLLSFYLHSGTSALMGYSLGRFRVGLTGYRELLLAVTGAIAMHCMYNLSTVLQQPILALALTSAIIVLITLQIFILFTRAVREQMYLGLTAPAPAPVLKPEPTRLLNLEVKGK